MSDLADHPRRFADLFAEVQKSLDFWVEGAILGFTEEVCRLMEEQSVNRAILAERLGTSQAYVTQILRGDANFTLKSMTKLAMALDSELRVHLAPRGSTTRWLDDVSFYEDAGFGTTYVVADGRSAEENSSADSTFAA